MFKSFQMKRFCSSLLLLLLSYFLLAAESPAISYTVSPLRKGDYRRFLIEMKFKGNAAGRTLLAIPFETGIYRPQDHFAVIKVINSKKHQRVMGDSSLYLIEHKPGSDLTVKYTIENALKDSLPTLEEVYAQMLTDKYFYLLGSSLWTVPQDSTGTIYDIRLNWKDFPAGWAYLNSFEANKVSQRFRASLSDFRDAIYMGGDVRVHKLDIDKKPLYFAIRGQWSFNDEEVFDIIKRTVISQRVYWNDHDVDRYTIALIPMKYYSDGDKSINGRGLTNAFVTVGTNSKAFGWGDLVYLYNHELMHHWFGHILKQAIPENAFKWFHEGFTDYFAHLVMLESGLFNQHDFKKSINNIFAAYYSDSTHQWPNEKLQQDYWSSYEMQKLPYQRGLIFAFYLDESIKFYSKGESSLKTILAQMLIEARQHKRIFSQDWLLELLQKATGKDYFSLLERFITHGKFISMADWEMVSNRIRLLSFDVFDLGFISDKGALAMNAHIVSVTEGANVEQAGLQVGDVLVGYSVTQQPSDTATLTVKRGEEKIKLRFLPGRQVDVPQLE